MSTRPYYVVSDDDCRFEALSREQIIAAIAEATGNTPTGVDDAFITKIKEQNKNGNLMFWVGTEAQYNALATKDTNTLYIVSGGSETDYLQSEIESLQADVTAMKGGTVLAGKAQVAEKLEGVYSSPTDIDSSFNKYGTDIYTIMHAMNRGESVHWPCGFGASKGVAITPTISIDVGGLYPCCEIHKVYDYGATFIIYGGNKLVTGSFTRIDADADTWQYKYSYIDLTETRGDV